MTWFYNGKEFTELPEGYVGFVYILTHKKSGKYYIGKKIFHFKKTKQVKGKKKRFLVESDWKVYYGSSDEVASVIQQEGENSFDRKILRLCKSKAELSYFEAKYQFEKDALLDPNSYNSWISVRVRRAHLAKLIKELENGIPE